MERKMGELDSQTVFVFEFLDTPGDEIAPRSNEVGKNFQDYGIGHKASWLKTFKWLKPFRSGAQRSNRILWWTVGGSQRLFLDYL